MSNAKAPDPTAPAVELLSKKALERLERLQSRLNVLDCRIESGRSQELGQERAEASALAWAIERIRTDADRLASLARELESVKADAERLDWMDTLQHRIGEPSGWNKKRWPMETDCHASNGTWRIYLRTDIGSRIAATGHGSTIRAAIDAARALPAPPEEKPHG